VIAVDVFFQAEDDIRCLIVTGVQTCALPICATVKRWEDRIKRGGFRPMNTARKPPRLMRSSQRFTVARSISSQPAIRSATASPKRQVSAYGTRVPTVDA